MTTETVKTVPLNEMKIVWELMGRSRFGRRVGTLVEVPFRMCEHYHLFCDESLLPPSLRNAWIDIPKSRERSDECRAMCNPKKNS